MNLKEITADLMEAMRVAFVKSADAQGHRLTGRLAGSFNYEVVVVSEIETVGRMYAEDYSAYLEFGVQAKNIPYTPGGGRGGNRRHHRREQQRRHRDQHGA